MSRSILIDCRLMMEKPDGIGRYLSQLVPELVDQAPDLHFHILRRQTPWADYGLEDLKSPNLTQHISRTKQMSLRQHLAVPMMARNLGVDLMHYPHYDAPVLFSPVPVVATIHDLKYLERPEWYVGNSRLKNLYARWSIGQTVKKAAAIISVSRYTAMRLQKAFPDIRAEVSVIHEAVGPRFRTTGNGHGEGLTGTVAERFNILRPFIFTVGERRPHKNHVGLINAYASSASSKSHDLVVAGGAYEGYAEPERAVSELGLTDRVHFIGKVDDADLRALYGAADLFVLVSKYEGFGLPILEAMSCRTPVIASSTTATGEIAGLGAVQVNPDDTPAISQALDHLLTDDSVKTSQIEKGTEWIENFSWRKTGAETLSIYRRFLTGGNPS